MTADSLPIFDENLGVMVTKPENEFAWRYVNLADSRLGAKAIHATDEFFAPAQRMLSPAPAEFIPGKYDEHGKWMDGWETRRRRTPGHDWCLIKLGVPARIHGVVVDTAFFRGNFPESCSLDACELPDDDADARDLAEVAGAPWVQIIPKTKLSGDTRNLLPVTHPGRVTHLRFNIYPDGGVARLRVHGEPMPDPALFTSGEELDLAAMKIGGFVVVCSDMFFGHRQNLILPGRSVNMGDGWETKRRRGPGHDWTIVRLAARGTLERIEIDTDWYKGNAPGSCMVEGCDAPGASVDSLTSPERRWRTLVQPAGLEPDGRHEFAVSDKTPVTHVRLSIYPDGGVARMRVFGRPAGT